jgi:uncharacterized zinc-type alcohol dehydrogenase-like protein
MAGTLERPCVVDTKGAAFRKTEWDLGPLGPDELEIEVETCGLCHTDIHLKENDWGVSTFPLVAGHEGVGLVVAVGDHVTLFKMGDRVGAPWIKRGCQHCRNCATGQENLCLKGYQPLVTTIYGPATNAGAFARRVRIAEHMGVRIPEQISSAHAAPLLCAGITVYTPLKEHIKRPGTAVGVVGLGGLGHLAVMFAAKMGCHVTVFSSSAAKEPEAVELGAHRFVLTSDADQMKAMENSQELILDTSSRPEEWVRYLGSGWPSGILQNGGAMVLLGLPPTAMEISIPVVVFGGKKVIGSIVGGHHYLAEMFEFAAIHSIRPQVEEFAFADINEAIQRLLHNQVRYRAVLKW